MQRITRLFLLITSFILSQLALAHDLVTSRAVLEDPTASLRIEEVIDREFQPIGQTLHQGYTQSAFWLRITVKAPNPGQPAVLLIRQPYLNEIRLFEASANDPGTWNSRVTGSYYANERKDRLGASPAFKVNLPASENTFYLRLKTHSMVQLTVEALDPDKALDRTHRYDLLQMFFATSMLALLLWAIHSFWMDKQAVIGWFILHQAGFFLYGMTVTGYTTPLFPGLVQRFSDELFTLPYCAVSFTTLLFCRSLFRAYNPPRLLMRGMDLLLLVFPFQVVAVLMGHHVLAAFSNYILVRVTWWYLTITTFTFRTEQKPSRRTVQIVFLVVTVLFTALWVTYSNATDNVQSPFFGRGLLIANGLIIGILFATLLSGHTRRLQIEAQRSQTNLVLAQRTLEIERKEKTKAELLARTDHLTGIANRRHFFEQGELEVDRAIRYAHPLSLMMIDIDHFKSINDTWGHSAGDDVLRQVSLLVRESLRSADLFGRTGGEEFGAILVETDSENALIIAERVRATVASSTIVTAANQQVQVTLSIGLTELKERQLSIGELMSEADRALYEAKKSGRNMVVSLRP